MPSPTALIRHAASVEPPACKPTSKRKGTRSVSTLTPSQLARKRANDREAQRAIRARTKEHIERLERELEELRCFRNRDRTVQDLLCRNRALEDEISRLRDSVGVQCSLSSSPYSAPAAYEESIAAASTPMSVPAGGNGHGGPSPRMSPLATAATSAEHSPLPDHHGQPSHHQRSQQQQQQQQQQRHQQKQHYVVMPSGSNNVDSWAANVPSHVSMGVSSPASSADEYVSGYIPTSVPNSMMPTSNSIDSLDEFRMGSMPMSGMSGAAVYMPHHQQAAQSQQAQQAQQAQHAHHQQHQQHQQQHAQQGGSQSGWPVYDMYYSSQLPPKSSEACLSR